jgi:GxxExxY protein
LCQELLLRGIPFECEIPLPLEYRGIRLECGYRLDLLVAGRVVVEVEAIEAIAPIHEAQLLTYLRLGGWKVGLLMNFNVVVLKEGIRRMVLDLRE